MTNNEPVGLVEPVEPAPADPPSMEPDESAPFGYTIDRTTGERRPKLRPGKQARQPAPVLPTGASPSLEELKAAQGATKRPVEPDRAPDPEKARRPRGKRARARRPKAPAPAQPKEGVIAKGVNKLYRKAGRIVRGFDRDLGSAIIATTRKDEDDDVTVGEAWEAIAAINPRIRGWLLRAIEGSTWSTLFWAHAPILLALMMKDGIRRWIPFGKLLAALLESDEEGQADDETTGGPAGGLQGVDIAQMMAMGQQLAAQMGIQMPRSAGAAGNAPRAGEWIPGGPVVDAPPDAA